jgi:putative CocE/NonD family hydrolase
MPFSRFFQALVTSLTVVWGTALPATAALASFAIATSARAQASLPGQQYERRELSIPVRDGTKLFAIALIPKEGRGPLPIILTRTPFGAERAFRDTTVPNAYRELAEDGYIFVAQDIRGRGKSGGTFVTQRAQDEPHNAPGTNESTDAYDTIDWLVKNLPNNSGKVGVMGMSYGGWTTGMAGVSTHPALKAI